MFVKQISVFLENKTGKLSEIVSLLADTKIDIQALLIAEAQDYGIMRIIVDKIKPFIISEKNFLSGTKVIANAV